MTTETTPAQVAVEQLKHLLPLVSQDTISVFDRSYDSTWFWCQCSALPHKGTLIRLKSNRGLYRPAPPPSGRRGGPCKDGDKLRPDAPATHGNPDGQWEGMDQQERLVRLTWWKHLHVKEARYLDLTVIRVVRPCASKTERDPRVSWFVWIGDQQADLVSIGLGYILRFSHEHGYRFQKQSLLWDQLRLRTPEQFERSTHRPVAPQQVHRAMGRFLPSLGTPARSPQPRGKSEGASKGDENRQGQALFGRQKDAQTAPIGSDLAL